MSTEHSHSPEDDSARRADATGDGPEQAQQPEQTDRPEQTHRPESDQSAGSTQPVRDVRPRPQYGEYAPEGWSWTPPSDEGSSASAAPPSAGEGSATPTAGGAQPARVNGVPHNLGAGAAKPARGAGKASKRSSRSGQSAAPTADGTDTSRRETRAGQPEPERATPEQAAAHTPRKYRDDAAPPATRPTAPPAAAPATPRYEPSAAGAPRVRTGDRVVTIILLAIGAFGAFNMSSSMFNLGPQLSMSASLVGADGATPPGWAGTVGTITGLFVLLVWALNLLFSIQRMRAGKRAFWVPLAAAGIAMVPAIIVLTAAMLQTPEIVEQLTAMQTPPG